MIQLSESTATEIEIARSGVFRDMRGTRVEFTAETLAGIASSFRPEDEIPLVIGHEVRDTTAADFGCVTSLRYDAARDRLLATIAPTPIMIRRNREAGFKRVSMELRQLGERIGRWSLTALAFLGGAKPAIGGLAPVTLAGAVGNRILVFAAGPASKEVDDESDEALGLQLSSVVEFAPSIRHKATKLVLAQLRAIDPATTYTAALEATALIPEDVLESLMSSPIGPSLLRTVFSRHREVILARPNEDTFLQALTVELAAVRVP